MSFLFGSGNNSMPPPPASTVQPWQPVGKNAKQPAMDNNAAIRAAAASSGTGGTRPEDDPWSGDGSGGESFGDAGGGSFGSGDGGGDGDGGDGDGE